MSDNDGWEDTINILAMSVAEKDDRFKERERIIKLLEETLKFEPWEGIFRRNPTNPEEGRALDVEDLIALIKGETE